MTSDGLDVQAVIDRFDASEQTLAELRERLRAIVMAEEGAAGATEQLSEASRALQALVREVQQVTSELAAARAETVAALEAARQFLSGTDLGALRAEIAQATEENRNGIAVLRSDMRTLAETLPTVTALRAENEKLKSVLTGRQRGKLGLA